MIESALSYIDPYERDTWVRMGMAIKSELGDQGFDIWDTWSQQADNYKSASAKTVWRSLSAAGGVTIGTLYFEARESGWTGEGTTERPQASRAPSRVDPEKERRQAAARIEAQSMLDRSHRAAHDYLARKGFPHEVALCLDRNLLVPMRDHSTNRLNSIQTIARDGTKKFLAGGKASGSVFKMGSGQTRWLVEGFATGLSVRAALRSMYLDDAVIVCFSAGNLAKISGTYVAGRRSFTIPDTAETLTGEFHWGGPVTRGPLGMMGDGKVGFFDGDKNYPVEFEFGEDGKATRCTVFDTELTRRK